ncbi:MAG: hypothetical protein LVQ96_03355 [Thermoplasmatales archaeon]|nr:hypothetical protein [Thermoplasmatales archaeon]MCW6170187.1 hypothetical protein [Thermoplasmatales archaeon]
MRQITRKANEQNKASFADIETVEYQGLDPCTWTWRATFGSLRETVINSDAVKANNMAGKTNSRAFPDNVKDATLYRLNPSTGTMIISRGG